MILLIVIILLLLLGYGIYRVATGNKALYRRWIGKQVPLWEYKNIITVQQGEAILSEYNAKRAEPAKRIDAIKAILLIGAIFVGLGVIFLVGANWHKIPLAIRTFGLLFVSVATLCSGYYYSYKEEGYRFLGKNLFLLSAILWGASLILICQIYNVPASDNWIIMILWALPILPMAHFFENRYIFVLASVLLIAWYFMYSISMDRPNYWYPVLVFGALIPMSGDFKPGLIMNTLFVLIAAYYCPFGKHEWLALFIGVFLFAQYFFRGKEPVYIYAATLSLAAWQITFGIARDIPNYFALIPLAAVFVVSYRERLTLNLFISICAFILWFHQIFYEYSKLYGYTYGIITTTVMQSSIGIVLFLVGLFHLDRDRTLADVYKIFGFVTVLGGAYVLSFKSYIKTGHAGNSKLFLSADLALLLIAFVMFSLLAAKKYFSEKPRMFLLTGISAAILANLFVLVYQQQVTASTVVMNLLIVFFAVISVFYGVELQNRKIFNSGILIFILFIVTRYFDIFWELKEKSWFFIGGGLLMIIGGAYLEKTRRGVIEKWAAK